ncbi:MAG: LLM class flavin-dependent oxidoreductase [Chloroflexota bacterium]|nr:LLM class flavin-dependent oxidoreductase [Chloroflexota bacterium]
MRAQLGIAYGSRQDFANEEIIFVAKLAEKHGYSTFFTGESWGRDALTLLTFVACHTETLRLATGIIPIFSRTPGLIAQSIASLDVLSGGRAILGLGTSGKTVIENWHGVPYAKPLDMTKTYIEIIRLALSGERVNFDSPDIHLQGFKLNVIPIQESIPIFIASLGPKNLQLTGQIADGWLPIWVHLDYLSKLKQTVAEAAIEAGRSIADITIAPQILCRVGESPIDRVLAEDSVRAHIAYYVGGMGTYYSEVFCRYGYQNEVGNIRDAWRINDRQLAANLVTDEMINNISVVGSVKDCRSKLQEFRIEGADMPVVAFPHGTPRSAMEETIIALSPDRKP